MLDLLPILQFIHQCGVIHRDIKPQNIIRRSSDGRLVLIDFGASKQLTATVQTKMGTIIGSYGYTPMEQIQDGKAYPASDLFSLGATCFHLLVGIPPFKLWMQYGFSWVESWQRYLSSPSIDGANQGITLHQIIDKLLKINIQGRYQTADEVMKDLTLLSPSAVPPTIVTVTQPQRQPLLLSQLNEKLRYRLLIGVGIVLLGGGIWYSQSHVLKITKSSNPHQPISTLPNSDLLNILKGHSSDVNSVVFSPDGKTLASGSDDKTIKLWNPKTGKEIYTVKANSQWVWTVAFSPDSKTLASGGGDRTIKLWDLATRKVIRTLAGHSDGIAAVAFSPDGKTLASSSLDKTIKLWNLATGKEIRTLKGHSKGVAAIAFSPDGETIASGSWDKTIKLWNVATGKEIRTLVGHSDVVLSVAYSPDNVTLASGSKDKTIRLWNLVTGKTNRTINQHSDRVNSVVYVPNPNGYMLASGSSDNTVKLWNLATGQQISTFKGDSGYVYSIAISPDGQTLASGGTAGNTLNIWRMPR